MLDVTLSTGRQVWVDYCEVYENAWDYEEKVKFFAVNNRYFTAPFNVDDFEHSDDCYEFPVYAYVHGTVTFSLRPFACRFDSARCGVITIPKTECSNEEKAREIVSALLNQYAEELNGLVYGIGVDGESIGGIYAESMLDEFKENFDLSEQELKEIAQYLEVAGVC